MVHSNHVRSNLFSVKKMIEMSTTLSQCEAKTNFRAVVDVAQYTSVNGLNVFLRLRKYPEDMIFQQVGPSLH